MKKPLSPEKTQWRFLKRSASNRPTDFWIRVIIKTKDEEDLLDHPDEKFLDSSLSRDETLTDRTIDSSNSLNQSSIIDF